jgi:hypothetical protein
MIRRKEMPARFDEKTARNWLSRYRSMIRTWI